MTLIHALELKEEKLHIINQTLLPLSLEYIITDDYNRIASAIERLEVRGAPAIGIAAAYALAFSIKKSLSDPRNDFNLAFNRLKVTRPTAVNLFYALKTMKDLFERSLGRKDLYNVMISKAIEIHNEDIDMCRCIGMNGLQVFKRKSTVLTHCNTGSLATGGEGTALNVIKQGFQNGLIELVYVDETRPLFQGSRLTAWELNSLGISFKIITDSTAAVVMKEGRVDLVITGADRIASNGDAANKIGTYNLSVLAHHHNIPFHIAAPTTTIDFNSKSGNEIKIELRDKKELLELNGNLITSSEYDAYCPAFDITPNQYISSIITEKSVHYPPYRFENV